VLGLDLKYVTAEMPGFNHWIWMTDFRYKGKDAYPLINEWIQTNAEEYWARDVKKFSDTQMSRAAIDQYKLYGLMPIGDTPRMVGWLYHSDLVAKKRWYGNLGGFDSEIGWQMYLDELNRKLSEIEQVALDESKLVSHTFKPEQSDEQIVPIINSLVNDVQGLYQVNIPNAGHILKGFPEDLVVECKAIINGSGVRGVGIPPLPERLITGAMIPRWHLAELKVNAMREQKYEYLLLYLLEDHRTKNLEQAESLLEEWLSDSHNDILAKMFKK